MATVKTLTDLFDGIVTPERGELRLERKIAMFNAAQQQVHAILTSRRRNSNWFVVDSQAVTPSAVDYFGPFSTTVRDYTLPPNCKSLRVIECTTAGYERLTFALLGMDTNAFKDERTSATANSTPFNSEVYYDIMGVNPGRMRLASFPPAVMQLRLTYVRTPTTLTAFGDSLDDFPPDTLLPMARWAATQFLLGSDIKKWSAFESQWGNEVERLIIASDRRDNTGARVVRGFLE